MQSELADFCKAISGRWRVTWRCRLSGQPRRSAQPDAKHIHSNKCGCNYMIVADHDPAHPGTVHVSEVAWHSGHDPADGRTLQLSAEDRERIMGLLHMGVKP